MNASSPTTNPHDRYLAALGDRKPIAALEKAIKRAGKLIKGRSEKELAWKPAPDKWSVKEILAHQADGEVILGARLRFAAAMDNPPIPAYDENLFVARLGLEKRKTKAFLAAWERARELNLDLLARLPKEAFARTGIHAERGPESVELMVRRAAGHDLLHDAQIERTLAGCDAARRERKQAKKAARKALEAQEAARKAAKKAKKDGARKKDVLEPKPAKKSEKKADPVLSAR
ncbi:MAG: DinB family protein [Planctomycetes bacterium]|nr:DinB family protein [Planctomycetota bacterium]